MKLRSLRSTRGFTLTELLVVAATGSILLALASPAVLSARLDARLQTCKRNLKQVGLALHNYHDTFRTFPPGWTNNHADAGPKSRYGWQVFILPFIGQQPMYESLDFDSQPSDPKAVMQTPIPVYRCPSDPTPDVNPARDEFGTSNYSGNFGPIAGPRWVGGDFGRSWPGRAPTLRRTDGAFHLNSPIRIREFKDGTTYVFIVGERSAASRAGIWMGVRGNDFEDDQVTDCSFGNEINSGPSAFSSRHQGGAHFLFGDGQVRLITDEVDSHPVDGLKMGTYQKLAHKSDGNVVGEY